MLETAGKQKLLAFGLEQSRLFTISGDGGHTYHFKKGYLTVQGAS